MNAEKANRRPDPACWAVACAAERADHLAGIARRAGLPAKTAVDLRTALASGAPLLLLDPTGWEEKCRRSLEDFAARPTPPPAVLLVGPDPCAVHTAGPAYTHLPDPLDPLHLAAAATRALEGRERFARHWPSFSSPPPRAELKRIKQVLAAATGMRLRSDRDAALLKALRTRLVATQLPSAREYTDFLEGRGRFSGEIVLLAGLLTVGETYFWRYAAQFRAFQRSLIPAFTRAPGRSAGTIRLWSAGCASGEEAYSLALAGLEAVPPGWEVQVVGTDLHRPSLTRAETGLYGRRTLRHLPPALRRKYLVPTESGETIREVLRRSVRFEFQNLGAVDTADWVERKGPFHAIFCRNTLIYFDRAAAAKVLDLFEGALVEGGGLFLGASESLNPRRPQLEPVGSMGSFHFRKVRPPTAMVLPRTARLVPELVGSQAEELYREGLEHVDAEDFTEARRLFDQILADGPEDPRGHTGLALLLANEGRETEAAVHLNLAGAGEPRLPETSFLQGLLAERRGQEGVALSHYQGAIAADPGFFMAHLNRAFILRRLGRRDACRDELRTARAILGKRPRISPWATGGMGRRALLDLVENTLGEEGDRP